MNFSFNKDEIKLRAPEPEDIDLLYEWENDASIWHLSNTKSPYSRFDLEQYILNSNKDIYSARQVRFMIVLSLREKETTIGSIDLFDFDPDNKRAGIGILIAENHRNKGFAGKALDILIDYCRMHLHLHQLFCNITDGNSTSRKLFENKGFRHIGVKKEWTRINKKWVDEHMFQLIF
ncbi:MAG: GNAT family N-acetyltransferase [Bacteroidales bacterium]|nr:GNAT family N-acetyltransferase [Bacteroidales bacterium]MCF8399177.1 GNAT family N-acetyltransferase [Bacteroidales bacterium]